MKSYLSWLVLYYLRFFARLQLKKYAPDIIGITGTAGKTSAQAAVAAVLKDKYRLKISHKANSESGIPLNILGLSLSSFSAFDWLRVLLLAPIRLIVHWEPHDKYVVEMGIDSPNPPKNMEYLLTIIQPRTGIFLNTQPMHSEYFDHLTKQTHPHKRREEIRHLIADEKGKLITSLPENGLAILNHDDDTVSKFSDQTIAQQMTFSKWRKDKKITVGFSNVIQTLDGTKISFHTDNQTKTAHFPTFLLPDHFGYTFCAALCIAIDEDYSLEEGINLLEKNYKLPPGRSTLIPGINGSVIIDSSYNASAQPTIDLLSMTAKLNGGRSLALLGDIRELGKETQIEHQRVIKHALITTNHLYLVGPLMLKYAIPYLEKHRPKNFSVDWFDNAHLASEKIKKDIKPGDVLLVKGSQNTIFLEHAVKKIMRRPEMADKILCRRGQFWNDRRKQSGLE